MDNLFCQLRDAIGAAKKRTNDGTISVRLSAGKAQVCRVVYRRDGDSDVTPVSEWMSPATAVDFLNKMSPQ